jgi:hypothetical protein
MFQSFNRLAIYDSCVRYTLVKYGKEYDSYDSDNESIKDSAFDSDEESQYQMIRTDDDMIINNYKNNTNTNNYCYCVDYDETDTEGLTSLKNCINYSAAAIIAGIFIYTSYLLFKVYM